MLSIYLGNQKGVNLGRSLYTSHQSLVSNGIKSSWMEISDYGAGYPWPFEQETQTIRVHVPVGTPTLLLVVMAGFGQSKSKQRASKQTRLRFSL